MPKTKISEFSATPANNTDIDSINISEGCAPSGINDAIRELMAQLKDWQSGTSNDPYVVGSSGSLTLNQGAANGVAYLNGSKVVTSGSALTFDGTNLGVGLTAGVPLDVGGAIRSKITGGSPIYYFNNGTYQLDIKQSGNAIVFDLDSSSEAMRLTSTGLGIGTTSIDSKLHVVSGSGSNLAQLRIGYNGTSVNYYDANTHYFRDGSGPTDRMVLNSSGNLGLGVTPSAWFTGGGYKVMQIGPAMAFDAGTDFRARISANGFVNSSGDWRYINTGFASNYTQVSGQHQWNTAPSGTAGNAITFTQAMSLTADGNLGVGTTSPATRLEVLGANEGEYFRAGGGTISGRSLQFSSFSVSGLTGVGHQINVPNANGVLTFATGSTERARIDSSGNLLVGTTSQISASDRLEVQGTNGIGIKCTGTSSNACELQWHSATSGDNLFTAFYTETSITQRGSITYNRAGGLVAYNVTSDYRAKDITGSVTNSGTLIDSVPVYMGKMKGATQERPMFIAHETPEYAHTGEKDAVDADGNPVYQQMDASALIPVMWAEIQSLRKRLADAGI